MLVGLVTCWPDDFFAVGVHTEDWLRILRTRYEDRRSEAWAPCPPESYFLESGEWTRRQRSAATMSWIRVLVTDHDILSGVSAVGNVDLIWPFGRIGLGRG